VTAGAKKRIAAVTVARSDYGILRPVLKAIAAAPTLELTLAIAGTHHSTAFGATVADIERDGFEVAARVDTLPVSDAPIDVAAAIGAGVTGFAGAYVRLRPDIVLLVGDRFETFAAAAAAVPLALPIAHLHGGELTAGAIDEQFRHAITKLGHVHFVCTRRHADRVIQMGEEPWRVHVTGAPALDNLRSIALWPQDDLESRLGIPLTPPPLLVTYHPVTLEYEHADYQVEQLVSALQRVDRPIVITAPNVDTASGTIRRTLEQFAASHVGAVFVENLGTDAYFSMMAVAAAMVGNSSSGLIEAASFQLPVVNVGNRQAGRDRSPNVIDVSNGAADILDGLTAALAPGFRAGLPATNPYGDGRAAERVVGVLEDLTIDARLKTKRFHDIVAVHSAAVQDQRHV
jgi:UDP-hydrolysing UDP-N-acetyl-D-glucosamine 2-epimerase